MRAIAIAAIALVLLAAAPAAATSERDLVGMTKTKGCHNVTGTCLNHGFVCANAEVVPHAKRCDGVEDCADGTDEFMCHHADPTPLHERPDDQRHAVQQASCIHCTCQASVISVTSGNAWWPYALRAPTDFAGLMTGSLPYRGRPCDTTCAFTILMAFYRKTGVCRGWLCCARQRQCTACNTLLSACTSPVVRSPANRCIA